MIPNPFPIEIRNIDSPTSSPLRFTEEEWNIARRIISQHRKGLLKLALEKCTQGCGNVVTVNLVACALCVAGRNLELKNPAIDEGKES